MAIVEMEEIELNENTQRVPIFNGYLSEIQPLLTVGWGQTETGDVVDDIRGTIVYTGNQTLCQGSWPDFKDNNSQLVCTAALLNPHHGVCFGDSGSGSFVNQDGVLMVVGPTASMSDPKGIFCIYDEGTTWYTRASYHLDAISQITGLSKEYLTGLSNEI
ncbi:hypothetical protein LPJ73_004357 [Coemansia sp. RSA 2703]|nr:hypothetical protein LPJ73_004357 [Coemansia sp. RSA 2703]